MCQNCLVKTIHHAQHHFGWDNSLSPVLHVASGSQLEFHCLDAANGWFNAGSTAADIPTLPFDKLNPVSGPVYVEGAQPGDALKVTLESFRPSGFGWTANIPGFGLLADQFSDPALTLWQYDRQGLTPCAFGRYGRVPLKPFAGTLGVAPAAAGAMLPGSPGTRIDSNGYAILPYLRPYRINSVEIDPKGSNDDVAFGSTVAQVVPWEGSVVKVSFDTTLQNNVTLQARQANGLPLPFAATIYNPSGKEIGVVGQGSMMFISDASAPKATVKWSGGQCSVELSQEKTKETLCR